MDLGVVLEILREMATRLGTAQQIALELSDPALLDEPRAVVVDQVEELCGELISSVAAHATSP